MRPTLPLARSLLLLVVLVNLLGFDPSPAQAALSAEGSHESSLQTAIYWADSAAATSAGNQYLWPPRLQPVSRT